MAPSGAAARWLAPAASAKQWRFSFGSNGAITRAWQESISANARYQQHGGGNQQGGNGESSISEMSASQ